MRLITRDAELESVVAELAGSSQFYLDTEFESNRRGTTLSLIQLSSGSTIFLLDALALKDLTPLSELLAQNGAVWVLHAGTQDVQLLQECLGIGDCPAVFDTQLAWGLLGPEAAVSLAYIQYKVLGIRSSKAHQADDWMRRPLPKSQLEYAASDIEHLPEIERHLGAKADALGRRQIIMDAFVETFAPSEDKPEPLTLDSYRNAWQLAPANQAALRELILWYNNLSAKHRAFVPPPKTLFSVASRLPRTATQLMRIKGVPQRFGGALMNQLLERLERAAASEHDGTFEPIEPPPYATFESIQLDGWLAQMRAQVSTDLSVAPELAFPTRVLKQISSVIQQTNERARGVEALSGWRAELLSDAYSAFCDKPS